eukprot:1156222-Pelagomonas_calceolata.AAC.4
MSTSLQCPLCGELDSAIHILSGCKNSTMSNMVTERHNIASRILLKAISKGPLGAGIASMDIGRADRLALQDLQILEHATNRTLPKRIFPRRFPDKVPRPNSRYLLRSAGGRRGGGNREDSAPATATPPNSKARHPSQLLPDQRHVHLVEVKYCEDTRPKSQLEASKQQHDNLCCHLSRASAQVSLHIDLLGVGRIIYTLEPLKELGLDSHSAMKLALKLHAHSVQYAYIYLLDTRHALKKTSFHSQAQTTASNPPDPHRFFSFSWWRGYMVPLPQASSCP